ncbi:Zinc finger domain containing protein [Entamoeba marina]
MQVVFLVKMLTTTKSLSCYCINDLESCYEQNTCKKESVTQYINHLYTSFNCSNEIVHANDYFVSSTGLIILIFTSFTFWIICCGGILAYVQMKRRTDDDPVQETIIKPDKCVIIPISTQSMCNEEPDDMNKICKVCLCNEKNTVFIPCGHICCCFECSEKLSICPVCRSRITTVIKTYDV